MRQVSYSFIAAIITVISLNGCEFKSHNPESLKNENTAEVVDSNRVKTVEVDTFGIEKDKYEVSEHRVRRGDTFTRILESQGLTRTEAHNLSRRIHPDFNVRRILSGRDIRFYQKPDSAATVSHIIYQHNLLNYTHINLSEDSLLVENNSRDTERQVRYAEGQISGSLYQTLRSEGHSTELAYALAEVFAWQLDFHRIRHGDEFRIIYEEILLDNHSIGVGDIKLAYVNHLNENFFAFRYDDEGNEDFYDEEGNSLRRSYMRAPLRYSRISSHFTDNRYHPVLGRNMPHHGVDYAAPRGTPVYAVGDGTIRQAHYERNNGNFVRIRHNSRHETGYLHLNRIADGIRPGVEVEQGDLIGYVGSTGLATGPHLCYRFWENSRPVDPLDIDADPVEPLPEEYMNDYESHIFSLMHMMMQLREDTEKEQEQTLGSLMDLDRSFDVANTTRLREL